MTIIKNKIGNLWIDFLKFSSTILSGIGGNRRGLPRQIFNLFVVWILTGFWHGANWNFLLWGFYYFVLLAVEKLFLYDKLQRGRVWPHLYALFFIVVGWGLFAVDSGMGDIAAFFSRLFWPQGGVSALYFARNYGVALLVGMLCSTPWPRRFYAWACKKSELLRILMLAAVLLVSVAYLVDSTYNPFIYFRF